MRQGFPKTNKVSFWGSLRSIGIWARFAQNDTGKYEKDRPGRPFSVKTQKPLDKRGGKYYNQCVK